MLGQRATVTFVTALDILVICGQWQLLSVSSWVLDFIVLLCNLFAHLVVGFILFSALAIWVLMQGGDSLDMGGEKHSIEAHAPAAVDAPVAASAAKP